MILADSSCRSSPVKLQHSSYCASSCIIISIVNLFGSKYKKLSTCVGI